MLVFDYIRINRLYILAMPFQGPNLGVLLCKDHRFVHAAEHLAESFTLDTTFELLAVGHRGIRQDRGNLVIKNV
jgi:hypothetical protein